MPAESTPVTGRKPLRTSRIDSKSVPAAVPVLRITRRVSATGSVPDPVTFTESAVNSSPTAIAVLPGFSTVVESAIVVPGFGVEKVSSVGGMPGLPAGSRETTRA